jgi:hypothetical protein
MLTAADTAAIAEIGSITIYLPNLSDNLEVFSVVVCTK